MWPPAMKLLLVGQAEMHRGNHRTTQRWLGSWKWRSTLCKVPFCAACCGRRRPSIVASCRITWVTRVSFTWSAWHGDSSDRKCSCCLCAPHICLIILMVFRRFLLSPPMPSQELCNGLWIEGGMSHRLHFQLQHLGLLGTSSLFISVLHCRRKFSLLRTTSGWYLCFSNSKHCWDS